MRALPVLVEVPRMSVEYLRVVMEGWRGGNQVDPTAFVVQFAFTPAQDGDPLTWPVPDEEEWVDGTWDTSNETHMAQGLFGPGTAAPLAVGDWVAWCRVVLDPEVPTRRLGILRIT